MQNRPSPLRREKRTIETMVRLHCRDVHASGDTLCAECAALLAYAHARLDRCPFGAAKPRCSACRIHCYRPDMREAVRRVMKHAGPRMLLRHPVQALAHAWRGVRHKQGNPHERRSA
jgi:hypothetical protein